MLALLVLAATVFTTSQGRLVSVTIPDEAGVKGMQFKWEKKTVPFVKAGAVWRTVIGVDLETTPGDHAANIELTFADGHVAERPVTITIERTDFPTTQLKVADKYVELSKPNLQRYERERKELDHIYQQTTPEILWTEPFRVPIPGQTKGSNFGNRRVFNGQARAPHAGADLKATTGTAIHATNRGRVVLAKNLFFTGNTVILDHGLGIYTIYAHLSRIDVKLAQVVEGSEVLGLAGATGRVTGPHLHWAAKIQGAIVDPFSLLSIK
jgi:murein DD-endopeptidase MepM/ murein hydrolase activator NlpD